MMQNKRFDFRDGGYWIVRGILTHGMVRRVQEALRDSPQPYSEADSARANDVLLLAATVEWSHGPEISQDVLEEIPADDVQMVLAYLNTLVGTSPLVVAAAGK